MALQATTLFAGIYGLIFVHLSIRVTLLRARHQVWFGDGGRLDLTKTIRLHGNFAEFTPFTLLLIYISELLGANTWVLHALGGLFLMGRILLMLAYRKDGPSLQRLTAIIITWVVIFILALYCFLSSF